MIWGSRIYFFIWAISMTSMLGCYSFKGISIAPEIKRFNVPFVQIESPDAPVGANLDFQQLLIDKITRESRLVFDDNEPQIAFNCALSDYYVQSISPSSNNTSDVNRLIIQVTVDYVNFEDTSKNWRRKFKSNQEFAAGVNFISVQETLTDEIFAQLVEDIFNQAFTDW